MGRFAVWGLICLLVGAAFLANALTICLKRRRFLATAEKADGVVVAVRLEGAGRNIVSIPTLEFRTRAGALRRAESLMGSGLQRFREGDPVLLWYDPDRPGRAEVASFAVLWGLAVLRAGFGVLFLVMGIIGLAVGR